MTRKMLMSLTHWVIIRMSQLNRFLVLRYSKNLNQMQRAVNIWMFQ